MKKHEIIRFEITFLFHAVSPRFGQIIHGVQGVASSNLVAPTNTYTRFLDALCPPWCPLSRRPQCLSKHPGRPVDSRPISRRTLTLQNRQAAATQFRPFPRLYLAHIGADSHGIECTAFVEATSHTAAGRKIVNVVAALEMRLPDSVADRIYNCCSGAELIETGLSDDIEQRLFETGWSGNRAVCFVEHPLFLIAEPAPLIRKWASVMAENTSQA